MNHDQVRSGWRATCAASPRLALAVILSLAATGAAAQVNLSAQPRPTGQAFELHEAPVLDGRVVDDPAWAGVRPLTEFVQVQPQAGRPISQRTSVFIGYTARALHIGVIAYDTEPLAIVSTDSRRDSSLDDTDSVRIMIDGLLDRQNGYVFGTNPAGIEYDGQVMREGQGQSIPGGEGGFNVNWDTSWSVATHVSDIGWSAEMEIPFTSLRFGAAEVQTWGFNFERRIRRNNEVAYWAPMSQERNLFRVSEAGSIEGVRVPRQRNLQFTPYVLGVVRDGGVLADTRFDQEIGFDAKYSITPSLTLDATWNTDFAQVEVDDEQVNLDRFSLFFPEKRAFFLENAGQFTVGNAGETELFFSRRIGIAAGQQVPIEGGLRLSGKIGPTTNIGLLHMRSDAVAGLASANRVSVARVNQELPNRSSIGVLFVDRNGDGSLLGNGGDDQNQTYAVDARLGLGSNVLLQGWAARTSTPGLDGREEAFAVNGEYSDADWTTALGFTQVGEAFNPELGFLARRGFRKADGRVFRRIRPEGWGKLFEIRPHVVYRGYWDFSGFQETGWLHVDSHWEFVNGMEAHTGINFTRAGVRQPFDIVRGVRVPAGTYDHRELQLQYVGDLSAPLNFSLSSLIGGAFGGDRLTLEPSARYRIGEKFTSELSYLYNDYDLPVPGGEFKASLARLRMSYSFTPRMLLQLLLQYNERDQRLSTNLRFSWLQSASTGLYLVYNEIDEDLPGALPKRREVIAKFSYLFDVLK